MSNYDIYVQQLALISESLSLPLTPMTVAQFDQGEAALQQKMPFVYTSLIDMDAFEASLES